MLKDFYVQNFKGLKDLSLANLGRINLISGSNNVGKTSLLEAFFLSHEFLNPMMFPKLFAYRGVSPNINENMIDLLFHNFNKQEPIVIRHQFNGVDRTIRYELKEKNVLSSSLTNKQPLLSKEDLVFYFKQGDFEYTSTFNKDFLNSRLKRSPIWVLKKPSPLENNVDLIRAKANFSFKINISGFFF